MKTYQEHQALWGKILEPLKDDPQALIAAYRELVRNDLYFLIRVGCDRADFDNQWLYERCIDVQQNPDGYLDLWARDHRKSTIITYGKTIQDIFLSHGEGATQRECQVAIFSHTRPIAKAFLRQIVREFEENPRFRLWFPDVLWDNPRAEAPKWSEDDGIIVKRKSNPKEATIEAWGLVDSQPIGKHFTHLIYDDIVTRDSVNTPEMIKKTTECLELSYNLGSSGEEKRRFIGTRYHFNDSYSTLMERQTCIPRLFPATKEGTVDGTPVLLTKEILAQKYRDMGSYTFSAQMLQNPTADENQGFIREWLRYHSGLSESAIKNMNVYLLVDSASSKKKRADYTAMWVVGLGMDGNYYILDIIRDRLNLKQRVQRVMELHQTYEPVRGGGVRYEKYGMMGDIEHLKHVMSEEGYTFDIVEVGGSTPKNDRIERLTPLFEAGRIYLPRTCYVTDKDGKTTDLVKTFVEEEYVCFPVPRHDDMLDALSRIAEPDLPLKWPKRGNVLKGRFGQTTANTEYNIFG